MASSTTPTPRPSSTPNMVNQENGTKTPNSPNGQNAQQQQQQQAATSVHPNATPGYEDCPKTERSSPNSSGYPGNEGQTANEWSSGNTAPQPWGHEPPDQQQQGDPKMSLNTRLKTMILNKQQQHTQQITHQVCKTYNIILLLNLCWTPMMNLENCPIYSRYFDLLY